ncbi:small, acid-soluble spore protein, alpha/beta type [Heliobacillus mobilis]|uniref:Small, acid-soluble spore protein, alpha/beta type n=2 Tax=Heliobacterium TaxID=2697 RepID=A0A6I3SB41_HELMO|nr:MULTISPECIES: small, acid-soluble spore protein, alpha/beta type [Heliobacterium]MBC9783201.1 small, acid-soluble spore protein, alpha/beta type [Heliobacterium chlorum]MTV47508.1 small, acid-soluble spore protein, alpha/beta type [Heliobacterium mobile]
MTRRKPVMSDRLKYELAQELGFADVVERDGWGGITTRDAGRLVRAAIERAERNLASQ